MQIILIASSIMSSATYLTLPKTTRRGVSEQSPTSFQSLGEWTRESTSTSDSTNMTDCKSRSNPFRQ
jgi:hypothetical protein